MFEVINLSLLFILSIISIFTFVIVLGFSNNKESEKETTLVKMCISASFLVLLVSSSIILSK
jgi:hypothetical protein